MYTSGLVTNVPSIRFLTYAFLTGSLITTTKGENRSKNVKYKPPKNISCNLCNKQDPSQSLEFGRPIIFGQNFRVEELFLCTKTYIVSQTGHIIRISLLSFETSTLLSHLHIKKKLSMQFNKIEQFFAANIVHGRQY